MGSTTTDPATIPQTDTTGELKGAYDRFRAAWRREGAPSYTQRKAHLEALLDAVRAWQDDIVEAISQDFGHRSKHESRLAELFTCVQGIKHTRAHLKSWMREQSRPVALVFKPGRAKVVYQPLGVVGIISPWNYPFQLAILPLVAALSAGNRVMIKPSEYTPATAEVMRRMLADIFPDDHVGVFEGGPEVGAAFSALPFDHLLYTGSTAVGKLVMKAASENLTPVTLELGGKSPAIIHESYPVEKALDAIIGGKMLNAGQTCIAPDYLLVHENRLEEVVETARQTIARMYPTLRENPDYTAIINQRHKSRLEACLADARERGARVLEVNPAGETFDDSTPKLAPHIVTHVSEEMQVMQEEIFGPILPIRPVRTLDEALDYVNDHPHPLALYYFDTDRGRIDRVLSETISGGVTINDTILHVAQEDLPFGGVGCSGMGAYHGFDGFRTFSHEKGVFQQSRVNAAGLLRPPFGGLIDRLLGFLIGR